MELKDRWIKETAYENDVSVEAVEKIINFQFKEINNASKVYKEIEITSFGQFLMSPRKAAKELKHREKQLENLLLREDRWKEEKVAAYQGQIEFLKKKLNEFSGDIRGVEE